MISQRHIIKTNKPLAAKKANVKELSSGLEINLGCKSCIENNNFVGNLLMKGELNLGRRRMKLDGEYPITTVYKTCSSGGQWLDEDLRGTSWKAVPTSGLFRDINGTATFYNTSEIKHRAEIRALRYSIDELEDNLEHLEEASLNAADLDGKVETNRECR
ncbi:MAG: hypothetical protein Q9214_007979, partial [Letrouitia sp. 1 TL-2023]